MNNAVADVIRVRATSTCRCEEECDCPTYDSLVFTVNGAGGFGGGDWVQGKDGKVFFSCKFLAWEFEADSDFDAVEKIKSFFTGFKHVEVTF